MSQVNKPSFAGTAPGVAHTSFPLVGSAFAGFHESGRRDERTDSLGCGIGDRAIGKGVQLASRHFCFESAEP
jgi:hypothetical protein